jgi:hypothetical protein
MYCQIIEIKCTTNNNAGKISLTNLSKSESYLLYLIRNNYLFYSMETKRVLSFKIDSKTLGDYNELANSLRPMASILTKMGHLSIYTHNIFVFLDFKMAEKPILSLMAGVKVFNWIIQ